ncbi:hypothetical protein O181_040245 [Austropuccinia psidii MF-1]|uniref:Aquaporin-like protein n=1 Tax=Austropuccinia psidii MF-1 TaxID=1389203 RepID=A0A9Q3HFY2_9BASI|nr:hypothetical protein [Austropuccinia psidii MF-1]
MVLLQYSHHQNQNQSGSNDSGLPSIKRGRLLENIRADLIAASGEFIGTLMFLLMGLGGIQAAKTFTLNNPEPCAPSAAPVGNLNLLLYVSTSMGLSLLFSAWVFYRATGAAFNPNVSFALLLVGVLTPMRFLLYCVAQFSASIAASALLLALLPGPLTVSTTLGSGTNRAQGLFIEGFITCALVLSVLFLAAEKHRGTYMAPLGIGLTLFACHLFAVVYTGAGMNTARSFGPAVITGFETEHWIYWLGPTLGSLLAVAIYAVEKRVKYWKVNEGQDTDVPSESPKLFLNQVMAQRNEQVGTNQVLNKHISHKVEWPTHIRNKSATRDDIYLEENHEESSV